MMCRQKQKCLNVVTFIFLQKQERELNSTIDLYNIFWKLKVIKYHEPIEGIIKKYEIQL